MRKVRGEGDNGMCREYLRIAGFLQADQFTTLLAQLLLAKASGLALKAKPIPRM